MRKRTTRVINKCESDNRKRKRKTKETRYNSVTQALEGNKKFKNAANEEE